ncbi:hypothetical protein [Catellatospora bangladeshensis]|nr:hypothetical protein [Catellatospora bangladeshensis]
MGRAPRRAGDHLQAKVVAGVPALGLALIEGVKIIGGFGSAPNIYQVTALTFVVYFTCVYVVASPHPFKKILLHS